MALHFGIVQISMELYNIFLLKMKDFEESVS